jgi:hypothetical protein
MSEICEKLFLNGIIVTTNKKGTVLCEDRELHMGFPCS